jgi:2-(1,2-epoxy-1,2-dihydrophenyl)acetyl-CoA isomerase
MDEVLLTSTPAEGVLQLTMNRPEALNSLTQRMANCMRKTLDEAARDPGVRAIVLIGAGRGFCAGADRLRNADPDPADPIQARWSEDPRFREREMRYDRLRYQMDIAHLLYTMPKPTLAAVRGPAVGAGLGLALACDLRVASRTAMFRSGFASIAYAGDYGCAYLLSRLVGGGKARELMLLDEKLDGAAALACGLVNWVVEDAELETKAIEVATRLAAGSPLGYRYMKRNFVNADHGHFGDYLDSEALHQMLSTSTEDAAEARTAFKEKRAPKFSGR